MRDNDRKNVEIYLKLIEYLNRRHDLRANNEWRVTISLWTMLIAITAFEVSQKIALPWAALCLPLIVHWLWLRGQWIGHENYKRQMDFWFERARDSALRNDEDEIAKYPAGLQQPKWVMYLRRRLGRSTLFGFLTNWASPLILGVTAMLSFIAYWLPAHHP
ncbi:hypothetical protein G6M50_38135 [Agrobacterium rhizogenes]|nr:hypothetical protein [Rhizobium rhizogenes]NTJ83609.1 hypothetical protein [Rhizobium rhizogenes]